MRTILPFLLLLAACGADDVTGDDVAGDVTIETRAACCIDTFPPPAQDQVIGGVELVAIDPDGTTTRTTSIAGHATVTVHPGASVTAIYGALDGNDIALFSYLAVEPGDQLVFGGIVGTEDTPTSEMFLDFPAVPGATYYASGSCGRIDAYETGTTVVHGPSCDPATETIYLRAVSGAGTQYGVIRNAAWVGEGTLTLDAWQPAPTLDVSLTGAPSTVQVATLSAFEIVAQRASFERATEPVTPIGGDLSAQFARAPSDEGGAVTATLYTDDASQTVRRHIDATTTSTSFHAADFLPAITRATYTTDTRTLAFETASDPGGDQTAISLGYDRAGGQFLYERTWSLVAPPDLREIVLPDLPPALDVIEPHAADQMTFSRVSVIDYDDATGWDDVRTRNGWPLSFADPVLTAPMRSTDRIVTFTP